MGVDGGVSLKKTMVYLEDDQFLLLKKTSASSNRKMAELIREALSQYFRPLKKPQDYLSFVGIAEGPKKGKTSEQVDETLREALRSSF